MATKKDNEMGKRVLAAGAAIAAGYYFFASKEAKRHRQKVADWAFDLKDEVSKKIKELGDNMTRENVLKIIEDVAIIYNTTRNVAKDDIEDVVKELKDNWNALVLENKSKNSHKKHLPTKKNHKAA